jgi:adenylate cyclase
MFPLLSRLLHRMADETLHSFLFADICGYSSLTERDGDEAAAELAIRFARKAASLGAEHRADLVKRVGDAVMMRGADAGETVRLGLRLHDELNDDPEFPSIHAGVHTGPAVPRAGDWWGATVNIAARVAAAAESGELLITEATKAAAGELPGTQLRGLGPRRFKNISEPVRIYAAARLSDLLAMPVSTAPIPIQMSSPKRDHRIPLASPLPALEA